MEDLVELSAGKEDNHVLASRVVDSEPEYPDTAEHKSKSTYSYEQLKSNSSNPVRGIDYKRREVRHHDLFQNNHKNICFLIFGLLKSSGAPPQ